MDISNPAVIIFFKESYEKESRLRLNWINNNRAKIQEAATLLRAPTNYFESDVIAYSINEGLPTIIRDHVVAGLNRRKVAIRDATFIAGVKDLRHGNSIVDIGLGDPKEDPRLIRPKTSLATDPVMRPIDPKLTEVLYKAKPDFGRKQYLKIRQKTWPEKKFYFADCINWSYGWRMGDSELREKATFGRCWRLTRDLKSRVGPNPDPPHYKDSELPGPSKCAKY
ncbi:Uncharacterized protein OBRU01_18705 [Operophtera brumata]|uniref:Sperm microtubule inner protein 1 C-terminal domain-containing protein n=1 Tax=Operophtera brumata TaxID=104452 RepID=A0A0L7KYQ4_OPEBR|nr:Uncharacterized protein OBRU01_18705 [Operophtera brumata]